MSIIKRDPFESLVDLQDEIGRWFGRPAWPRRFGRLFETDGHWAPRIDVFEDGNDIVVKADLPGVKKEDVEITLEGGDLVLKGERKAEKEIKEEHYYRMEHTYGSFYRRVPLPAGTAATDIKASFKEGVLELRAPKPVQQKPGAEKIAVA